MKVATRLEGCRGRDLENSLLKSVRGAQGGALFPKEGEQRWLLSSPGSEQVVSSTGENSHVVIM